MSQPIPLYSQESTLVTFRYLQEIIRRYRRNVHHLESGASEASLKGVSDRLNMEIPEGFQHFLRQWNGGLFFRNALQIRSTMELAFANRKDKAIILFADSENGERWAYAKDGHEGFVFGLWASGKFIPMHSSFEQWLNASLRLLDEGPFPREQQLKLRTQFDENSAYLPLLEAEILMHSGQVEKAQHILQKVLSLSTVSCRSWAMLGDCFRSANLTASYNSYLEALKRIRFPCPYLEYLPVDSLFIQRLSTLATREEDRWFTELRNIWNNRIHNVQRKEEFEFVETIICAMAQEYIARGEYFIAQEFLLSFLERKEDFSYSALASKAQLLLSDIFIQLGQHDDAERLLRLLQQSDSNCILDVNFRIARIATLRQEPWGLDILFSLLDETRDKKILTEIWLLAGQYYTSLDDFIQAKQCITNVEELLAENDFPQLSCELQLLQGDLHRKSQQLGLAEQYYQRANHINETLKQPLLKGKILLRRGDLLRACDEHQKAQQYCMQALTIFKEHHCAFDEAWALTHLGHYNKNFWRDAKKIFRRLDLALGVSMIDQLMGEESINWHIDQCQEHTKRRVRAQKALPPLQRLDAEMPERRIFGHKMAIINCDEEVLTVLSAEMFSTERELRSPSILPSHQKYARFVACAELIAQYPSYRASEIILQLVSDDNTTGIARRALLNILSRTRNIGIVEGLMSILEPGAIQAGRLLAIEALGWRKEKEAIPLLLRIVSSEGSSAVKKASIIALGRIGEDSVVGDLLRYVDDPVFSEVTAVSLLLLGEWSGLDKQAQALAQGERGRSSTLGHIVGHYGGSSYLLLLLNSAQSKEPVAISAVHGLGYLGDARVIPRLIEFTGSRTIPFAHAASQALEMITGHYESIDEYLLRARWSEWYEENGHRFVIGTRYRYGKPMSPEILIERLAHDDLLVRRASYDELVIYTGVELPFDAEGPWRVQLLQRREWANWWLENQADYPIGQWLFHGRILS